MKRLAFCLALAMLALAAGDPTVPADWLARGDAALADGDAEVALAAYRKAGERTLDPGRAAFNQGVALFQLGRFREAEKAFRCALDDTGVGDSQRDAEAKLRHGRALYNLGNCLLKQSAGQDRALLRDAAACYELCFADPHTDGPLLVDARHNLELARLLRQKARSASDAPERDDRESDQPPPPRPDPPSAGNPGADPGARPDGAGKRAAPGTADGQSPGQNPLPGQGNLPPIPDDERLAPLTPEDLQAHLKAAEERIRRDKAGRLRPMPVVPPRIRDW